MVTACRLGAADGWVYCAGGRSRTTAATNRKGTQIEVQAHPGDENRPRRPAISLQTGTGEFDPRRPAPSQFGHAHDCQGPLVRAMRNRRFPLWRSVLPGSLPAPQSARASAGRDPSALPAESARLSRQQHGEAFPQLQSSRTFTSACGVRSYRDRFFNDGNLHFTCRPFTASCSITSSRRRALKPPWMAGALAQTRSPANHADSWSGDCAYKPLPIELLASEDRWCRPSWWSAPAPTATRCRVADIL